MGPHTAFFVSNLGRDRKGRASPGKVSEQHLRHLAIKRPSLQGFLCELIAVSCQSTYLNSKCVTEPGEVELVQVDADDAKLFSASGLLTDFCFGDIVAV